MIDRLFVIGTSFRRTGFTDLSSWTIPTAFRKFALRELGTKYEVEEAVYLSTCNRSELILWVGEDFSARRVTRRWREWASRINQVRDQDNLTIQSGAEAARYLFRVASSLDSLVVGETEILRQMREAHALSEETGLSGANLRRVLERALKTGREVRNETSITSLSTSVVSVSIKEIKRRLGGRRIKRALVIGAGETGRSVARSLRSLGHGNVVESIAIANRTLERAEALAEEVSGTAHSLDQIDALVANADVVVSAVAVPYTLIDRESVSGRSDERPLLLVDLAIPPNVAPECAEQEGVSLLSLSQLEGIVEHNRPLLVREIEKANKLVDEGFGKLRGDFKMAEMAPFIQQTRASLDSLGQEEIRALLKEELQNLEPGQALKVEKRLQRMLKRLLHTSTKHLKEQARLQSRHEKR